MGRTVSATEARVHFGELIRHAVESQEPIIVERRGQASYRTPFHCRIRTATKRAQDQQEDWLVLVDKTRKHIQEELGDRKLPPLEDILRQIRKERDAQLWDLR
jgi:hypothetical protein